ncbi:D-mannonate dehydratase [Thermoanaerobacterium sp. PSU-2]|uniref:C-glycoside deglycosidase beta subunit domain-containing protein n=1 Tax=Thermoanaerobacterium sp. PSU-2 TaxID=1930849 RepID=UPI000A165888|nr:DUF6379 domain-containing protein [Thermoanaerobacterium sp. PSU-2]ORX23790.1 D-mannonate dehydratase [Thermoanaerobacterium sp. PSU-2]
MLEKEVIQYRGFHNIYENGVCVGFQLCIRSPYYRGVWLSQIRPGRVIVDGEVFPWDTIIWVIDGKEYTTDELAKSGREFWRLTEPAVLKVKKAGGLKQGYHDVSVRFGFSASYMPPSMDRFSDDVEYSTFNGGTYSRKKMIIV